MEASEPPPPASCLPTETALQPAPQATPTQHFLGQSYGKGDTVSPGPSGNPNKTSRESSGWRLGGMDWKDMAGTKMGWGGSELSAVQPSGQEDSPSLD